MKKILVNLLALGLVGGAVVACSSGSSSNSTPASGPAAPSATAVTPPNGFTIPAGSASGAAFNLSANQLAVPGASGYTTLAMPAALSLAIQNAGTAAATVTASGSNIVVSVPSGANTLTYVLTPVAQSSQSQSLQAVATTAESYTYESTVATTNLISIESSGTSVYPHGLVFGTSESLVVLAPNPGAESVSFPISGCTGVSGTISTISAAVVNTVGYVSVGTSAGSVCVFSGSTGMWTNLSSQAPTGKYTPGYVNNFGFPSTLNTGATLVGYWNVGTGTTNIYRVTGYYNNGTPTGNGFLNTTSGAAQTTTNGTTQVTFTNVPSTSAISSSYVDAAGNVWVGTTNGSVYVLRTGATAWTNTALTGATGAVTVQTNGGTSGATATSLIGGASQSFAVN
ncbi:MAG TPA: hypothetical protein PLP75_00145 [Burkholderiales bacterium]|nr:hypothetical protein [Burkholderiales bacterium]